MLSIFKRLFHCGDDDNELRELIVPVPRMNIQIKKTRKDRYYWRLINLEGKVLAISQSWLELGDCLKSASAVSEMYIGEIISSY
jgi:hypothetical protein